MNNSSPCEFSSTKLLILAAIAFTTALLFYSVSFVLGMTPEMYVDRIEEEIGNYSSSNFIDTYVDQIRKAINGE